MPRFWRPAPAAQNRTLNHGASLTFGLRALTDFFNKVGNLFLPFLLLRRLHPIQHHQAIIEPVLIGYDKALILN